MNDLEITKKCAEAMGLPLDPHQDLAEKRGVVSVWKRGSDPWDYDPLHNDAQAMALVKEMRLQIETVEVGWWIVSTDEYSQRHGDMFVGDGMDLNRAICECVAKKMAAE